MVEPITLLPKEERSHEPEAGHHLLLKSRDVYIDLDRQRTNAMSDRQWLFDDGDEAYAGSETGFT